MSSDLILIPNDLVQSTELFEKEREKLLELLVDYKVEIEHIGSTAVAGTVGKGIIDILLIAQNEADQKSIRQLITHHGYRQGELDRERDGRLFFCNTIGQTHAGDVHLHVVIQGSEHEIAIALRDYLRSHSEDVEEYNQEKQQLAIQTNNNRQQYVAQKAAFVSALLDKVAYNKY